MYRCNDDEPTVEGERNHAGDAQQVVLGQRQAELANRFLGFAQERKCVRLLPARHERWRDLDGGCLKPR